MSHLKSFSYETNLDSIFSPFYNIWQPLSCVEFFWMFYEYNNSSFTKMLMHLKQTVAAILPRPISSRADFVQSISSWSIPFRAIDIIAFTASSSFFFLKNVVEMLWLGRNENRSCLKTNLLRFYYLFYSGT